MKLLVLVHTPKDFGTYYRAFFLMKYLKKTKPDIQINFVCLQDKTSWLIKKEKVEGINFFFLPTIDHAGIKFRPLNVFFYFINTLVRIILYCCFTIFSQYDVLHSFALAQPQIALATFVANKTKPKAKIIIDWDDLWTDELANTYPRAVRKIISNFEYNFLRYGDFYTCISQYLKNEIIKTGIAEEQIAYLPNICNTDNIRPINQSEARLKLGLPKDIKILLTLGNTHAAINFIFTALSGVIKENTFLYILGSFSGHLDNKNIIAVGRQPSASIEAWLSAADVLLLPMSDSLFDRARFPVRFGDYLCAGKPIVSNAVAEVKYYMEKYNCGLYSDVYNQSEFKAKVLSALNDSVMVESISNNALGLAHGALGGQEIARQLADIYQDLTVKRV